MLADFKRHTARSLLAQLKVDSSDWMLNQLSYYRLKHKTESEHQIWQEGSHPQAIVTDEMMLQQAGVSAQQSGQARAGRIARALAVFIGARVAARSAAGAALR